VTDGSEIAERLCNAMNGKDVAVFCLFLLLSFMGSQGAATVHSKHCL
jgi:hypothetical protein